MRQLEEENLRLQQIVADLTLDKQMPQYVLKKALRAGQRRELVRGLQDGYRVSVRRACRVVMISRRVF
ncbi:MAG: hypothetical protein IPM25_19680 [Chloracidobacterium sp.]|nr:hypothetical protein [Chloracidobacterium sp.]